MLPFLKRRAGNRIINSVGSDAETTEVSVRLSRKAYHSDEHDVRESPRTWPP
jgi:hypothetical protein